MRALPALSSAPCPLAPAQSTLCMLQAGVQTEQSGECLDSQASVQDCLDQLAQAQATAASARADAAALRGSVEEARTNVDSLRCSLFPSRSAVAEPLAMQCHAELAKVQSG